MKEALCALCGAGLDQDHSRGTPRRYCSVQCRRARETELRRLRRQVVRLEAERADVIARDRVWEKRKPAIWAQKIADTQARIAELA